MSGSSRTPAGWLPGEDDDPRPLRKALRLSALVLISVGPLVVLDLTLGPAVTWSALVVLVASMAIWLFWAEFSNSERARKGNEYRRRRISRHRAGAMDEDRETGDPESQENAGPAGGGGVPAC